MVGSGPAGESQLGIRNKGHGRGHTSATQGGLIFLGSRAEGTVAAQI